MCFGMNILIIENCINQLAELLNGNLLSAVVDGAGGPLYNAYPRIMRTGGILSNYGQNPTPQGVGFSMLHVLKNIDLKGSSMGSRKEFKDMIRFVDEHKIKPIVFKVWKGLTSESVDEAIDTMRLVLNIGRQYL